MRLLANSRPCALLVALVICVSSAAQGKSSKILDYRLQTIWSSAIRLLRVDSGYEITEKHRDSGYILFVFPGSGAVKHCPASLEIFPINDPRGYERRRLQLNIAHQPKYVELHLLERLERKLREEYGPPPQPSKRQPQRKPAPDKPKTDKSGAAKR